MRQQLIIFAVLFSCSVHIAAACGACDEKFAININRPTHAGDEFHFHVEAKKAVTVCNRYGVRVVPPIKYEKSTAETSGILKIVDVNDAGNGRRVEYRVETLRKDRNDLLKAGDVVSADFSASPVTFTLNQKNVSAEVAETLHWLMAISSSDHPSEENADTMFGTNIQRQTGETWSVHHEAVANWLSSAHLEVKPDDVSGEATLDSVVDGKNARDLKILTRLSIRQLKGKVGEAGPDGGRIDGVSTLLIPAAPGPATNRSELNHVHTILMMHGTDKTGQQYTSDVVIEEESSRSLELLIAKNK